MDDTVVVAATAGVAAAAAAFCKQFNVVNHIGKRYFTRQHLTYLADAYKHNARMFWLYFNGAKKQGFLHNSAWNRCRRLLHGGQGSWAATLPMALRSIEWFCRNISNDVLLRELAMGAVLKHP